MKSIWCVVKHSDSGIRIAGFFLMCTSTHAGFQAPLAPSASILVQGTTYTTMHGKLAGRFPPPLTVGGGIFHATLTTPKHRRKRKQNSPYVQNHSVYLVLMISQ